MNALSGTDTEIRESLPPIECASWCQIADGHADEWHPEDQWCGGEGNEVTLTRMPMVGDVLDRLTFYLARRREGNTHVRVELHGQDAGELSLDEVRKTRDALTALLMAAALA
jgi:Domain of unknown function (DUF6907)